MLSFDEYVEGLNLIRFIIVYVVIKQQLVVITYNPTTNYIATCWIKRQIIRSQTYETYVYKVWNMMYTWN